MRMRELYRRKKTERRMLEIYSQSIYCCLSALHVLNQALRGFSRWANSTDLQNSRKNLTKQKPAVPHLRKRNVVLSVMIFTFCALYEL